MPDGAYNFAIAANSSDDQVITVPTFVVARVTGVDAEKDGVLLSLGPTRVAIDKVTSIRETATNSGT